MRLTSRLNRIEAALGERLVGCTCPRVNGHRLFASTVEAEVRVAKQRYDACTGFHPSDDIVQLVYIRRFS